MLNDGRNLELRLEPRALDHDRALLFKIRDHGDDQRIADGVDEDERKEDRLHDAERGVERLDDQQNERKMEDLHHNAGCERPPRLFQLFMECAGENPADYADTHRRDDAGIGHQLRGLRGGRADQKPVNARNHARDQTAERSARKARKHRTDVAYGDDRAVELQTGHGAVDAEYAAQKTCKQRILPVRF